MAFVSKVWDGTRFVNTDSDTLDNKHIADVYQKATALSDSTSFNLDSFQNEEFCSAPTGVVIGNGQVSSDGFYLWAQKYGTKSNQVAFTPTNIKLRSKVGTGNWSSWRTVSFDGHNHDDRHVKLTGSTMTGNLYMGVYSETGLKLGNGDNASIGNVTNNVSDGVANLILSSWYGVGFSNSCAAGGPVGVNAVINTRNGDFITRGSININNTLIHKGNTIISADGKVHSAVYNDLAEYFLREDSNEYIEPGDIVVYNNGGVTKSTRKEDPAVVGVYSDTFGVSLGGDDGKTEEENKKKYVPVGLAGRVYVKVVGDVAVGDLITTSEIPGVGRTSVDRKPGTIIGKALEEHTGDGIDRICLLILNQ